MADRASRTAFALQDNVERTFPVLTTAQVARMASHGHVRPVEAGEVLLRAGEPAAEFFVVTAGRLEGMRQSATEDERLVEFRPGQFTGEVSTLLGRRAIATIRAVERGEVIEVRRADLLSLLQTDGELSDLFMRAFILRRVELAARSSGAVPICRRRSSERT